MGNNDTKIREIIMSCSNCNTVIMVLHNGIIPIHCKFSNIECQVCHAELNTKESIDMWTDEPDDSYKYDYINKEELR